MNMHCRKKSGSIISIARFAYLIVPAWMISREWIVAAGLTMIGAALLPWAVWLSVREDLSGPATGMVILLTAMTALLALIPYHYRCSASSIPPSQP